MKSLRQASQGRPKGIPDRLHALRALFPREHFAQDIHRVGGPSVAAENAGVARSQIFGALRPDGSALRASTLEKVLDGNGIDRSRYAAYLAAAKPTIVAVCLDRHPGCRGERIKNRGRLTQAQSRRREQGLPLLEILPDGRWLWPCGCAARASGGRHLKDFNESQLARVLSLEDAWVLDQDEDDDDPGHTDKRRREILDRARLITLHTPAEKLQQLDELQEQPRELARALRELTADAKRKRAEKYARVSQAGRRLKDEGWKAAIARAHALRQNLEKPVYLCPLDGLLVYGHPWHPRCAKQWQGWRLGGSRRHGGAEAPRHPPPVTIRGRPVGPYLTRDVRFLLDRLREHRSHRELAESAAATGRLAPYGPRPKRRKRRPSKSTPAEAIRRLLGRMPASWDHFFSVWGYSTRRPAGKWRKRGAAARHRAAYFEERCALRDKLQPLVECGARDRLIARLDFFGMPVREIAALTGAPEERVQRVIEGPLASEVAAELGSWLDREARSAADVERERTQGYARTGTDIMRARIGARGVTPEPRPRHRPINLKLTHDQAQAIVAAPAERGVIARLARQYNVTPAWVSAIRRGRTVWTRDTGLGTVKEP